MSKPRDTIAVLMLTPDVLPERDGQVVTVPDYKRQIHVQRYGPCAGPGTMMTVTDITINIHKLRLDPEGEDEPLYIGVPAGRSVRQALVEVFARYSAGGPV